MFGLSFTRGNAPATPSASPPDQNQKSKRRSPIKRTLKKLKKVITRSGSKEILSSCNDDDAHEKQIPGRQPQAASKSTPETCKPLPPTPFAPTEQPRRTSSSQYPRTEVRVASPLPVPKTASSIQCTAAPLSNRSNPDRDYPKPKTVYTPAGIANAKYNENLAKNTAFSHKISPPREERRSRRDHGTGCHPQASSKPAVMSVKETVSVSCSDSTHKKPLGRHSQAASRSTACHGRPLPPVPSSPTQPTTNPGPHHLPRTPKGAASSLPTTKTACKFSSNGALLANPSELRRYLDQFPKPKIIYTPAEAKVVAEAFVANAKYEEELARKTHFSHKIPKPREQRPSNRGYPLEARMGSSRYSTACEGVRRSKEVPRDEAWQDTRRQAATTVSKLETTPAAPCSITMEEMEMIIQDPTQLDMVWNRAKVGAGSCEYKSAAQPKHFSITTADLEEMSKKPVDIDWEGATKFESWYWELQKMRPWTWSFIAEEMEHPDFERQRAARNQAYLKLVKNNIRDGYPRVF
ncbi:hypothetical protein FS837_003963 [Tulasnella sp. UAMH 9824]|nr:hypothetical protein FS837_003963 [Tulasnella sp. UAMH 9824]